MRLETELLHRIALATDHLSEQVFKTGSITPLGLLHTASLFLTVKKVLYLDVEVLDKLLEQIQQSIFSIEQGLAYIQNDRSMTSWNAMCNIIACKQNGDTRQWLNTLSRAVERRRIIPNHPLSEDTKYEKQTSKEPGLVLLALLWDNELQLAETVAKQILHKPFTFVLGDVAGLQLLASSLNKPAYKLSAERITQKMLEMPIMAMTPRFAAYTQQACLSCNQPSKELLSYQFQMQQPNGSFQGRNGQTDLYDTTINVFTFIQWLHGPAIHCVI